MASDRDARDAQGLDFLVRKDDWRETSFGRSAVPAELEPGQVLFRVDRFALTSNNVSYALAGDMLGYWKFFPTGEPGWGRIPVMGFADVARSAHPDVREGERVFGFFPMSRHLVIQAEGVSDGQMVDAAPHRADTAPAYRQYTLTTGDPLYEAAREDQLMLLRGLFLTSFLVDDFLAENDFFGARAFVVSSASSKTAVALAHRLAKRGRGPVVGLTSPRNAAFVESLGSYDRAVTYADLKTLPADVPTVFVDHSGDGEVVNALHRHLAEKLVYSCSVGATHWDAGQRDAELPGAAPTFFFAPAQIQKRAREWGPAGFQQRVAEAWRDFSASSDAWLRVVHGRGPEAVERTWRDLLEGRARPSDGHVLSLQGGA